MPLITFLKKCNSHKATKKNGIGSIKNNTLYSFFLRGRRELHHLVNSCRLGILLIGFNQAVSQAYNPMGKQRNIFFMRY
jgi:hypothetical protein